MDKSMTLQEFLSQPMTVEVMAQRRKLPTQVPRIVRKSVGFTCPAQHRPALNRLERELEEGRNIHKYLSVNIVDSQFNDLLFNHWGIHHLHLGDGLRRDGFVKRTPNLLFCRFEEPMWLPWSKWIGNNQPPLSVYFLCVMPHGTWSHQKLLRILHENWPESIQHLRLNGVKGDNLSDEQIQTLRDRNLNVVLDVQGVAYTPMGGGVILDGTAILDTILTDSWNTRHGH